MLFMLLKSCCLRSVQNEICRTRNNINDKVSIDGKKKKGGDILDQFRMRRNKCLPPDQ